MFPAPRPILIPEKERVFSQLQNFRFIMVAIRLRREGSKDRPYYRIVVADSRSRRDGPFIDQVGVYDPLKAGQNYVLDLPKVDDWITKGAQPSETVASIIRKTRKAQPKA